MSDSGRPGRDLYIAVSCISVGVGPGGRTPMLARVGVIDFYGQILLETFVVPEAPVTDYRTNLTGITSADLDPANGAVPWEDLRKQLLQLFNGRVLVGHQLWRDLSILGLSHRAIDTRDNALYYPFRNLLDHPGEIIGLRTLMWKIMGRRCQEYTLHPIETARANIDLYRTYRTEWESAITNGDWPCDFPPTQYAGYFV